MPIIKPNFDEVQTVVPGKYPARIIGSEAKTSKKGNTYTEWKYEVFGADDIRANGATLFNRPMQAGRGAFRLQNLVEAATGEKAQNGVEFDSAQLHGREILVTVVDGKDQNGNASGFPDVVAVARMA